MEIQAVFVVVVLTFTAATTANTGGAVFSGKKVTLTCPEPGHWFKGESQVTEESDTKQFYEFDYTKPVEYTCKYTDSLNSKNKYMFYIKGRACENCFELDGVLFLIALTVDLTATSILMIIIYKCNKKNTSEAPTRTSKAPVRSGGMAPPVPSPDYESLNPNTRSADTYSTVVNRMG